MGRQFGRRTVIGAEEQKRVRLRLDVYDPAKGQYRPLKGKAVIIPLETTRLHHALWRALILWLRAATWRKEITAEEAVPEERDEPAEAR